MPVSFETVQGLTGRAPDAEHRYGAAPSHFVWAWEAVDPVETAAPIVVLLHGGCWSSQYGVDHVRPLATALADAGFAVWAPEYRRNGEPGGGWPGTFTDVAAAIDLLKELATPRMDTQRVVLVGHSAGGHLALWAAARSGFPSTHPLHEAEAFVPEGAIGLAAVTDLAGYAADRGSCQQGAAQLMGGAPDQLADRYRLASPASLPRPVPIVLLHGTADPIVPAGQALVMPGARIRPIEGAGHFDLIHPGTPAFAVLLDELSRLLGDA